jgi:hypothetical protein
MNSRGQKTTVYKVLPPLTKPGYKQRSRFTSYRKVRVLENTLTLDERQQEKRNQQLILIKGRLLALYLYLFELFYILSK